MELNSILQQAGITPIRETKKEIHARCPMHVKRTGKPDAHPSWSINRFNYAHFCFSCGYKGTLQGLLIDVTGSAPEDLEKTLLKEGFLRQMEGVREHAAEVVEEITPILTEWALYNIMLDVPQRMLTFRHLDRHAVDTYDVRWDVDAPRWVLPLRSPEGDLLGAQYRQKGSVYTLPEGMEKSHTLFGFPQCCDSSFCALVESPLDAIRLYGIGVPAVSSLGAWVSRDQITLLARNFTRVYVALDNDRDGNKAAEIICPLLHRAGCVPFRWDYDGLYDEDGVPAKDPGDVASDDDLLASWSRTMRMGL